jgi:hypothetical protein
MPDAQVNIAYPTCELSNLMAFTADPGEMATIIRYNEPFSLQVTVKFGGVGAIALMPLALHLKVDFSAKPVGAGDEIEIGTVTETTVAGLFAYSPTLKIAKGPRSVGLLSEKVYRVTALLQGGAAEGPALIVGIIDPLTIQIYKS